MNSGGIKPLALSEGAQGETATSAGGSYSPPALTPPAPNAVALQGESHFGVDGNWGSPSVPYTSGGFAACVAGRSSLVVATGNGLLMIDPKHENPYVRKIFAGGASRKDVEAWLKPTAYRLPSAAGVEGAVKGMKPGGSSIFCLTPNQPLDYSSTDPEDYFWGVMDRGAINLAGLQMAASGRADDSGAQASESTITGGDAHTNTVDQQQVAGFGIGFQMSADDYASLEQSMAKSGLSIKSKYKKEDTSSCQPGEFITQTDKGLFCRTNFYIAMLEERFLKEMIARLEGREAQAAQDMVLPSADADGNINPGSLAREALPAIRPIRIDRPGWEVAFGPDGKVASMGETRKALIERLKADLMTATEGKQLEQLRTLFASVQNKAQVAFGIQQNADAMSEGRRINIIQFIGTLLMFYGLHFLSTRSMRIMNERSQASNEALARELHADQMRAQKGEDIKLDDISSRMMDKEGERFFEGEVYYEDIAIEYEEEKKEGTDSKKPEQKKESVRIRRFRPTALKSKDDIGFRYYEVTERDTEAIRYLQTLIRPQYGNPFLVGSSGSGKDEVIRRASQLILLARWEHFHPGTTGLDRAIIAKIPREFIVHCDRKSGAPILGSDKKESVSKFEIIEVSGSALQTGQFVGSMAKRVEAFVNEMKRSGNNIYISEFGKILQAGSHSGGSSESLGVILLKHMSDEGSRISGSGTPQDMVVMARVIDNMPSRLHKIPVRDFNPALIKKIILERKLPFWKRKYKIDKISDEVMNDIFARAFKMVEDGKRTGNEISVFRFVQETVLSSIEIAYPEKEITLKHVEDAIAEQEEILRMEREGALELERKESKSVGRSLRPPRRGGSGSSSPVAPPDGAGGAPHGEVPSGGHGAEAADDSAVEMKSVAALSPRSELKEFRWQLISDEKFGGDYRDLMTHSPTRFQRESEQLYRSWMRIPEAARRSKLASDGRTNGAEIVVASDWLRGEIERSTIRMPERGSLVDKRVARAEGRAGAMGSQLERGRARAQVAPLMKH